MKLNAEELARIEKSAVYSLNDKTLYRLLDHIAALESELAISGAARVVAEAALKVIEIGAGDAAEKTDIARRYFAHTEESQ